MDLPALVISSNTKQPIRLVESSKNQYKNNDESISSCDYVDSTRYMLVNDDLDGKLPSQQVQQQQHQQHQRQELQHQRQQSSNQTQQQYRIQQHPPHPLPTYYYCMDPSNDPDVKTTATMDHSTSNNPVQTVRFTTQGIEPIDFLHWSQSFCGIALRNESFNAIIVFAIVINAILMGISTFSFVTDNPSLQATFQQIDLTFLILFTIEVVMQLFYRGYVFFYDKWLLFDFLIISFSWILAPILVTRAFRVLRILRLIPKVQVLQDVVNALIVSLPRMIAIVALMQLVLYIFTVMFTQLFGSAYNDGITDFDYFSRLDKTYFTLFQLMTLDSWSYIARQLTAVYPWAWLPVTCYVLLASFIALNLVIAVICDAVAHINHSEEQKHEIENRSIPDTTTKNINANAIPNHASQQQQHQQQNQIRRLEEKIDILTSVVQQLILLEKDQYSPRKSKDYS